MRNRWRLAAIGVVLILLGGIIASFTQTDGGTRIEDVRFVGTNGATMSALLYIPPNATPQKPAPGILAVHGYINSRETQAGFAIEFARRGYVVLALDQMGHGYSSPPAFANGFGGPDGLRHLRSLPFVDKDNIGLEGHSMGGWTVLAAATAMPGDYKAMVLEGSSTGKPFAADGTPSWPRNLALVFSKYDEFSQLMWGVARAQDAPQSKKLQAVFGTDAAIEPSRVYGSVDDGTARVLYMPAVTHPGDHISRDAIGYAIAWFQQTLKGGTPLPRENQIWPRKEFGTLVQLIGFVVLLLGAFQLFLAHAAFERLALPIAADHPSLVRDGDEPPAPQRDGRWWLAFALSVIVPAVTYYPALSYAGTTIKASAFLPQTITSQIAAWALLNAAITALLMLAAPKRARRMGIVLPSILIAVATAAVGYLALTVSDLLFKTDFRFWVVGLKLLSGKQALIALIYLPAFTLFFLVAFRAYHRALHRQSDGAAAAYASAIGAFALAFLLICLIQYGSLFVNGALLDLWPATIRSIPLNTILATQFLPLMAFVAIVAAFTLRRTGTSLPGALLCALVVTWYIVAGQATQAAF